MAEELLKGLKSMPSSPSNPPRLIAVYGPTASGKSTVAEWLSQQLDGQLIAADAFQIYRGLNIGTNKPSNPESYLMVDICEPEDHYGLGAYLSEVGGHLTRLFRQNRNVVIVGGTGLYLRALLDRWDSISAPPPPEVRAHYDSCFAEHGIEWLANQLAARAPDVAAKTDLKNPSRVKRALEKLDTPAESLSVVLPEFEVVKIGLQVSTPELNQCIATRVHAMIASGWVEEVKRLLARGVSVDSQAFQAIGYSPLASHITHGALLATTLDQVILETVQYAKRQRSWLRSERNLIWLHSVEPVHKVGETLAKQLRRVAIELT